MQGAGRKLDPSEYNEAVRGAIDFLNAPMPRQEIYVFSPDRFYVPAIENGVNVRYEVTMKWPRHAAGVVMGDRSAV